MTIVTSIKLTLFTCLIIIVEITNCSDVPFKPQPATLHIKSSINHLTAKNSHPLTQHHAPIDQQVQQHLHQFQLQQRLSSPQPLMSSVATLIPSSNTPSLITATGSPLVTSTPATTISRAHTTQSPILASSLITTSSATSGSLSSKASRAVTPTKPANTYDWDLIYKVISRVTDLSNISQGIKRSIGSAASTESSFNPSTLNSLLYGLSMAAGLAVGVSIADSPMVSSFLNRVDHRFLTRSSNRFYGENQQPPNPAMMNAPSSLTSPSPSNSNLASASPTTGYFGLFDTSASSESKSLSDPIVQRNVALSKDGKDHYHHVVHYHIPYPLSVGALDTAKTSYPNIPWFSSDSMSNRNDLHHHHHHLNHQVGGHNGGFNSKMSILSGYLGPFFGYNNGQHHGQSLKDTLASRISSLPFIGSSIIGSSNNGLSNSYATSSSSINENYNNNNDQHKNTYNLYNQRNHGHHDNGDRYNYNYDTNNNNNGWQGRDHNYTNYNNHQSHYIGNSGNSALNSGNSAYGVSSYEYPNSYSSYNDQNDHNIRRNDPYQVFSDSEYFKSLNTHSTATEQQKPTTTKKKSNSRKNRPKKPTMEELIYTGSSSASGSSSGASASVGTAAASSSNVNLVDQSSTSSPSPSSTLSDLLAVTNS